MIRKLIILVTCLIFYSEIFAQNYKLDLSFENFNSNDRSQWMATNDPRFYMFIDTVNVIEGKQSIVLADRSARIYPVNDFVSSMLQYIELPDSVKKIDLSVFSKTRLAGNAWMKAYVINKEGLVTFRDSVSLISDEWNESHLTIPATQATFLYLEIFMHKKHNKNVRETSPIPCLWVDNIQLKLDGKDISSYQEPKTKLSLTDSSKICNHIKINRNSQGNIDLIKEFREHRILAFGETVHTSNEIQHFFYDTTKEIILNGNCRLLLLEYPFDNGLLLNEFIKGNKQVNVDELLYSSLLNPEPFISFLNWLRDYNSQNNSNVNIVGIDEVSEFYKGDRILYQLIENQNVTTKLFLSFKELLKNGKDRQALHLLNNSGDTLMLELGKIKFSEIKRGLELRNETIKPDNDLPDTYRDFILFQNAKLAINNYLKEDEKAVVYTHLGHVNKKNAFFSRYDVPSFGYYMQREFGNSYFVTAVTVGSGTIAHPDPEKRKNNIAYLLNENKPGSLEALCALSPDSLFFLEIDNIGSTKYIRSVGNRGARDNFYPFIPEGIIDGNVFIRKSSHYRKPADWPNTRREYILKKHKDKI